MSENTYYIEHDGKQLRTFEALKDWFLNKIKKEKKKNPDFNERHFAEAERTFIFSVIYELNPTDNNASDFKKTLFEYLLKVIYKSLHHVLYPVRLPQDIYMSYLTCFNKRIDIIPEHVEQKQFLDAEIERHERINSDWAKHFDITDSFYKHVYDAVKMFLYHMKMKLTNYEHTATTSAHENITAHYYTDCGLPIHDHSILFPEQIENRIIMECVAYKRTLSDNWQSLQTDNEYFVKFINGTLLREFKESIFETIRPLNDFEINRVLTLSLEQFKTFKPDLREKEFIKKYSDAYWHPNPMDKVTEGEAKTAKYLISVLSKYYQLFINATEQALIGYQSNLYGLSHIPQIPVNKLPSNKTTPMQQDFILQKRNINEPASFQDLLDEAMENDLIEYIEVYEESEVFKEYKANFKNWICKKINQSDISSMSFRTYFKYANFEQFITDINHPDYDNSPAFTIYDDRPFDKVFDEAVRFDLIIFENTAHRAATYSEYDYRFTTWMQEKFNIQTDEEYRKHCTLDNFKLLIKDIKQQERTAKANYEREKLKHQMDAGLIDADENTATQKKGEPQPQKNNPLADMNDDSAAENEKQTFDTILSKPKQEFILKMLEDLSITKDGKSILGQRKKSVLRGAVQALLDKSILPQLSLFALCRIVATRIDLDYNSKLKKSFESDEMNTKAIQYIKQNYKP